MSVPVVQLPSPLAHQTSSRSLTAQVSQSLAFPTPQPHAMPSSGPTSGLLSVPQNYGTTSASPSVTASTLSLHNPSTGNGSINSSNQGLVQATEAKRREIQAAWTELNGEIPVIDKDGDSWTLTFEGALAIKDSKSWKDGYGVLLDSHLLLFEKETTPTGTIKYTHMIKAIPLECLRSASFNDDPVVRKQDISLFNKIGSCFHSPTPETMYPFTIYHAAAKITRRYTLYAPEPRDRNRWRSELVSVIEAQRATQHGNELYRPRTLDGSFFRVPPRLRTTHGKHFTGHAFCAAEFSHQGVHYLAVGCTTGIYVRERESNSPFRIVLESHKPTSIVAVPDFDLFLVHCESALLSYPLNLVISVSQSQGGATPRNLYDLEEKLNQKHEEVLFFKVGQVAGRTLIVYATKGPKPKQVTSHVLELDAQAPSKYNRLGPPMPASEDPHDATFCPDKVVICTSKTLHIVENIGLTNMTSRKVVPEVENNNGGKIFPRMLKRTKELLRLGKGVRPKILELMDGSNILGSVRCENNLKTLIIYEEFGCFIDDQGRPADPAYYVPWETRATAYALRGDHLLLFSSGFIEVRSVETGKLVQIKEVSEMLLLRLGSSSSGMGMPIAVMPGIRPDDDGGRTERLVELVYHAN